MTGLELLLAISGVVITVLVVTGMVLIAPRGAVQVHTEGADPQGANLSPRRADDQPAPAFASR